MTMSLEEMTNTIITIISLEADALRVMVLQGAVCHLSFCQHVSGITAETFIVLSSAIKRRVSLCPLSFNTLSQARALILRKLTDICILGKIATCRCSRESNPLNPPIPLCAYLHTQKYSFSQGPNPPCVRRLSIFNIICAGIYMHY